MRLLTKLRYSKILIYPEVSLINKKRNNLVTFERDLDNPLNEGFIIYWEIIGSIKKQLLYKKRLTSVKAQNKLNNLKGEGWIKINELEQAA